MSSTIVNDVVKPDFVSGAEPAMPTGLADFAVADAAVERLRMAAAARACAEAELAAAVVGVADLVGDRNYDSLEVAAVLAWTPRFAAGEVAWCRSLMENLPRVFGEWRAGRIDRHRAWVFADCLSVLILAGDDALLRAARQIADRVLPQAPRWTASRLRADCCGWCWPPIQRRRSSGPRRRWQIGMCGSVTEVTGRPRR